MLGVNGTFSSSGTGVTLGSTFNGTAFALFQDQIGAYGDAGAEKRAIVHEAGHLLGLVNLGTAMQTDHDDPQSPNHDVDSACVMYRSINATSDQFCEDCRADLKAAGGR